MENLILWILFELRSLQKLFFAPTKSDGTILMSSSHMRSDDRASFDNRAFYLSIKSLNELESSVWKRKPLKDRIIELFHYKRTNHLDSVLNASQQTLHMTDEQLGEMMDMFWFYLGTAQFFQDTIASEVLAVAFNTLFNVIVALLKSNRALESKAFLREFVQDLKEIRNGNGSSLLHKAANSMMVLDLPPCKPILRFLIEEGDMDVNVLNSKAETPLHIINEEYFVLDKVSSPVVDGWKDDLLTVAKMLIDNGAHMDILDIYGNEASSYLSFKFPEWSMNTSLKCLAAKAILKHNLPYKKLPAKLVSFIELHIEEDYEVAEEKYKNKRWMLNKIRKAKRKRREKEEKREAKKSRIEGKREG